MILLLIFPAIVIFNFSGPATTTTSAPSDSSLSYSTASMSPSSVMMSSTPTPTSGTSEQPNSSASNVLLDNYVQGTVSWILFYIVIVVI